MRAISKVRHPSKACNLSKQHNFDRINPIRRKTGLRNPIPRVFQRLQERLLSRGNIKAQKCSPGDHRNKIEESLQER